jgi:hypothetical protein
MLSPTPRWGGDFVYAVSIQIPLTRDQYALIDDEDYEQLSQYKWTLDKNGYVVRKSGGRKNPKKVMLHRFIMNAPPGFDVDHIDHDLLNNCRANLRICTRSQNNANRLPLSGSTSQYKGVSWNSQRRYWSVYHTAYGQRRWLGSFDNEVEAAITYDNAAYAAFGEFAYLNFPERFT